MLAKSTCRYFLANLVNHVLKLSSCYTMSKWQKSIKPANRTVINILSGHRLRRKWRNCHKSDGIELKAQTYSFFVNEISLKQKDAQPLMFALETWMIFLVMHTPAAKLANLVPGMRRTRSREQSGATHHQDGRQDITRKISWSLSLLEIALVFARVNFPNAYSILRNLISLVVVLLAVKCGKLL